MLPEIISEAYDREGTPGRACKGCNCAWPASEGDSDPCHHDDSCPWYDELCDRPLDVLSAARRFAGIAAPYADDSVTGPCSCESDSCLHGDR